MTTKEAEQALQQLMLGGAFNFDPNLPTVSESVYLDLVNTMEASPYEIAYESGEGTRYSTNIIEKSIIDRNPTTNLTDLVRKERTYEYNGYRIFQLQLDTVPLLVITGDPKDQQSRQLVTTWWLNKHGGVIHYRVVYNGEVIEDVGIFNR
jgi:hypothetical protein